MALDYNNPPLLLDFGETAEVFRCSKTTLRNRMRERPGWLVPMSQVHTRRLLFRREDVLAAAGVGPRGQAELTAAELDAAARKKANQALSEKAQKHQQLVEAQVTRMLSDPRTWRLTKLQLASRKVRVEAQADDQSFRVWLFFQRNYRPDGWPAQVGLPLANPGELIRLDTDEDLANILADVEAVLASHAPLFAQMGEARKDARLKLLTA